MANFARNIAYGVDDEMPIVTAYWQEEETGGIIDLTGAVSVKFWLYPKNEDGTLGTVKIDGVAGAIDGTPTTGKTTYTWAIGDLDTLGFFIGYFIVYWGAASTQPQTGTSIGIRVAPPEENMS